MTGSEKVIVNKIRDTLEKEYPNIFIFKSAGGPFQQRGLPDLIACINGRFIGIEVKQSTKMNTVTKLQQLTLNNITKANGLALVCCDPEYAIKQVKAWMNTCLLSKG